MTKTEHIKDRNARARAGMSGIMVVNRILNQNQTRSQITRVQSRAFDLEKILVKVEKAKS
jgi:hypothetical protein